MGEEALGVCLCCQSEHSGLAPAVGLPHQQHIGPVLTVGVALTEEI